MLVLCRNLQPPTWSLSTVFSILELEQLSHSSAPRRGKGGVGRKAQDVAPTCQSQKASLGDQGPHPHPRQPALGQQGALLPSFHTQDSRMASITQALRASSCAPAPCGPQASGLVSQAARGAGAGAASDRCPPRHSPPPVQGGGCVCVTRCPLEKAQMVAPGNSLRRRCCSDPLLQRRKLRQCTWVRPAARHTVRKG